MTIDEILEKLYEEGSFEGEHRDIHPDRIAETKQAILSWFKEQLPKERTFEESMKQYGSCEDAGYNRCLQDTLTNLTAKQGER